MAKRDDELDKKRLDKTKKAKADFENRVARLEERLGNPNTKISQREDIRAEIQRIREIHLKTLNQDLADIQERMQERQNDADDIPSSSVGQSSLKSVGRAKGESQHDYLVRTGKITPFSKGNSYEVPTHNRPKSHQNLIVPGMELEDLDEGEETEEEVQELIIERHRKKRKMEQQNKANAVESKVKEEEDRPSPLKIKVRLTKRRSTSPDESVHGQESDRVKSSPSRSTLEEVSKVDFIHSQSESDSDVVKSEDEEDEYIPETISEEEGAGIEIEDHDQNEEDQEDFSIDDEEQEYSEPKSVKRKRKAEAESAISGLDDGNIAVYKERLARWISKRKAYRNKVAKDNQTEVVNLGEGVEEWQIPHPTYPDAVLDNEFKVPGDIYTSLFDYQRTGVQWLWELYSQKTGGIIGDEMGLGKTIQIVSFLAGLHYSGKLDKPALVVCPATVMKQWVNEFHRWWPALRVVILHSIGSGMDPTKEQQMEEALIDLDPDDPLTVGEIKKRAGAKSLVDSVMSKGHVLITTYVGMRIYSKYILPRKWGYCVLDEGHKIRNPDSDISLKCKQVKTANRIILSGTPIQNNLTELWSLFDFVFPGRLGTLPVFQNQFSIPINVGGYANATNVQVQTAYKCAVVLRDIISPYMLRRMKVDVAADLPKKSEKVLFCKLTKIQNDAYQNFLKSDEMKSIFAGKRQVLFGVDILRKICNHPDLVNRDVLLKTPDYEYGLPSKSGKMQVVKALVELWKSQNHKTLLFCQTRQMLDILQRFILDLMLPGTGDRLRFLRMDGTTPIANRQRLVDEFNSDPTIDIFLLTTKVGGLGVNLTGADRVIIYDPDWNPSTDVQARERAWRLGQKKDVVIYRLMTAGAIEEKIYHRQIFKQFLTNKILKDPKQRRFFKMNDLHDLFTLGDLEGGTETGGMFSGTERTLSQAGTQKKAEEDDLNQVSKLGGVAGLEDFQTGNEVVQDGKDKSSALEHEDSVLEGIFAKSGVQSTLEHDSIMEASRPDTILVEREASRVATQAANALRESRNAARKAQIGTPTWTGRFGSAGRVTNRSSPLPKGRLGTPSTTPGTTSRSSRSSSPRVESNKLSSTSILQNIRQKRELEEKEKATIASIDDGLPGGNLAARTKILKNMVSYLYNQPEHKGKSASILAAASVRLDDTQEVATIRQMLREIASWNSTDSTWTLKEEFCSVDRT
ncbi:DNA-dependent ATPase RAD26 [Sugiyamaella lignohabitans]|uniref:DNA-dependent ATPase RAD26 n=1 Tax=Sugiyamaella lignohabitans TaxID=796027 RepID=A0A167DFJ8_9ASCO|nr:DNA-dependent ATPase RAD26 [Sugiyamaella lignohabitans]ANB12861.1 DNA-dependent ATPase RAD26 [Sugiyamaella lignohabitans]